MPFQLSTIPVRPSLVSSPLLGQITAKAIFATSDPVQERIGAPPLEYSATLTIEKLLDVEIQTRYDLY